MKYPKLRLKIKEKQHYDVQTGRSGEGWGSLLAA